MKDHSALQNLIDTAQRRPLNDEELEVFNNGETGLGALLGLKFTFVSADEVRTVLEVSPRHHQPWGIANGGVYASIAESTGSIASVVAAGGPVVGVNNNTDFIKGVSSGIIEARATPVQVGRTTHIWSVEMRQDGELVARTTLRTMVRL